MKGEHRSLPTTLIRCLRLLCPVCGLSSIFHRPFRISHHCPTCDALFKREEGFFVGAVGANLVTTEVVVLVVYVSWLLAIEGRYELMMTVLILVAAVFPAVFYHHSWSLWLGFDYLIESLPKYVKSDLD
jgi:uncharacterized protein (DUF983 family)